MRDIKSWRKEVCEKLKQDDDLQEYVANLLPNQENIQKRECLRIARLIADVELGLTLLQEVAPEEAATAVDVLLSGYRFPVPPLQSDRNWQLVQKARFYLIRRKGRQWRRSLEDYLKVPNSLKIYRLNHPNRVPKLIASNNHQRLQLYRQTLSTTPEHIKWKVQLATEGRWFCKVSQKGELAVEIPIDIPEIVANIQREPVVRFQHTRTPENPAHSVTWDELLLDAREMDEKIEAAGQPAQNYRARLEGIELHLYQESGDDFTPKQEIAIEEIIHLVGLLNVGKSTLLEILIYHLAKQGKRCALIVNDVVSAVRLASLFWHQLQIPAAPVLGSNRAEHLKKVYESILANSGEEITEGGMHPAWRWFSSVCPLLGLVKSQEIWEFGSEPCHSLYQKVPRVKNDNLDTYIEEVEEQESREKSTCPLYYECPRHQLERDLASALVWVLTPASFVHTRVPRHGFKDKITFAEAVYRECDFLFVDEADRVQVQFDRAFSPDEVLVEATENCLLNQLGRNFANQSYMSDRRHIAAALFLAGKKANDYTQIATDVIANQLYNQQKLVEWLGQNPFTGRSLFARIIRDLVNPPLEELEEDEQKTLTRQEQMAKRQQRILAGVPEKQRQCRKSLMQTLEKFLQYPLDRNRGDRTLSDLALRLLYAEDSEAFTEVTNWCKTWLDKNNISPPEGDKFDQLIRQTHFAIVITVLDDRLGFVIDHISELSRVIDLHNVNQSLVHRPPRDYLPVLPSSPVGNILGFLYKRDRRSQTNVGGKLSYFRYVGVGRALLLNFPTLFAVDNWDGPHTVLVSGTSYAPGSPAYHIRIQPTGLLKPKSNNGVAGDQGIAKSEFMLNPMMRLDNGKYIALSGLPPERRKSAIDSLVKAMCYAPGNVPNFIDDVFRKLKEKAENNPEWWSDRQRILMITGSYDEAELVASLLKPRYRIENIGEDSIYPLQRDNDPAEKGGIRRGKIPGLKDTNTQIVIAPLMALERGHNILNNLGKAAFGAAIFLNRPMPVPDNWQETVRQLNNWAIANETNSDLYQDFLDTEENLPLTKVGDRFYRYAVAQMLNLNCTARSFQQLTEEERSRLCWTQLVSMWQIIGRLVRGGVPADVYFIDVKFAPNSAEGELDSAKTSLLVGMLESLAPYIEGNQKHPYEQTLGTSLYHAFYRALENTKGLKYE